MVRTEGARAQSTSSVASVPRGGRRPRRGPTGPLSGLLAFFATLTRRPAVRQEVARGPTGLPARPRRAPPGLAARNGVVVQERLAEPRPRVPVGRRSRLTRRVQVLAPPRTAAPPLRVAIVSVAFAHPSTTFAGSDVRALRELGAEVSVHDMVFPHRQSRQTLRERGLAGLPFTHLSWRSAYHGARVALGMPLTTLRFLAWVVRHTYRQPRLLARCMALTPRVFEIFGRVRHEAPDVVHLFWGETPALVGRLLRWKRPETRLSMFLGAYDLVNLHPYSPSVAREADTVWTHAHANVAALRRIGIPSERIRVCPRGIPIPATFGAPRVAGRIVTAGRLIPTKGMDDTLRAFALLRRKVPHASLVVLGEGPEAARLEALTHELGIADAVEFRGHVPRDEVFREMARAEAFLLMTRHPSERLPNVVKEAMSVGCIPVVCQSPGIEELIDDGRGGFIVPQGDVKAAADRLGEVFQLESRRPVMETAARIRILVRFDVRKNMTTYLNRWRGSRECPPLVAEP